jgi:hypothetical protein
VSGYHAKGRSCLAKTAKERSFCFFHEPDEAERRRAAQVRGGQANRKTSAPQFVLKTPLANIGDLVPFLVAIINGTLQGKIPANVAKTVCNLENALVRVLEGRDLEELVQKLRQSIREMNTDSGLFDPWAQTNRED